MTPSPAAAAEAGVAPAVVAVDPAARIIVMELVSESTHAPTRSLLPPLPADLNAQHQLALLKALCKLQCHTYCYAGDLIESTFLPLTVEMEALIIDYGFVFREADSAMHALFLWLVFDGVERFRMLAGLMRDHLEWFGFTVDDLEPRMWDDFLRAPAPHTTTVASSRSRRTSPSTTRRVGRSLELAVLVLSPPVVVMRRSCQRQGPLAASPAFPILTM